MQKSLRPERAKPRNKSKPPFLFDHCSQLFAKVMQIAGWQGCADQATKVRGVFVRPEQVERLLKWHSEVSRARVQVGHDAKGDTIVVTLETERDDNAVYAASIVEEFKLCAEVAVVDKD